MDDAIFIDSSSGHIKYNHFDFLTGEVVRINGLRQSFLR